MIKFISPKDLYKILIERRDDFDLLDIRSKDEYLKFHLPGAVMLNINSMSFIDYHPTKDVGIFYCSTSRRTLDYIDDIKEIPYKNHYILLGGLNSWKKLLLPVCSEEKCKCAEYSSQ